MATASSALIPSACSTGSGLTESRDARIAEYRAGAPFPHIVLDGLFSDALLDQAVGELPASSPVDRLRHGERAQAGLLRHDGVRPDGRDHRPRAQQLAIRAVPGGAHGHCGLIPDPHLHAAGYMKVSTGGLPGAAL